MMHEAAIKVLEEHCVTLDQLSVPNRHTVTLYSAEMNRQEAADIRNTIEALKKEQE